MAGIDFEAFRSRYQIEMPLISGLGNSIAHVAAAVKVTTAVHRMEQGNFSNVKGVGAGVYEYRIDFGPGYRIYFGKDGDRLVILLAGGTKKR